MNATLGLIVGNRGFFPDSLCEQGRNQILQVLEEMDFNVITLSLDDTKLGAVETREEAMRCATLFEEHAEKIEGVVVTLPNFGDERGVAETLRMSRLDVPVLVHAFPDEIGKMTLETRRDSFCGKLSVCNNLYQYGIPFSLTTNHTTPVASDEFKHDLDWFARVCKVVNGLRNARIGAIGTRPAAFNTVRYSEKLLEASGLAVEPIDLSEILGKAGELAGDSEAVKSKLANLKTYINTAEVPEGALTKMARFQAAVDEWIEANTIDAVAIQCWTAMQEYFGIVPCAVMSMLSSNLIPAACEVDVCGAVAMYALQLASNTPSALVDWNNNYGNDPDKAVLFHCSNYPVQLLQDPKMGYQEIISATVGKENTYGACKGRIKPGPFTFARLSTDDTSGSVKTYVGTGEFTSDQMDTFGGFGVAHIPGLQTLLRHICTNGFEHHVAISQSQVAGVLREAFANYLGWSVYYHDNN